MDAGTNEDFELLQSLPQDEASAAASPPAQTQLSKVTQGPFSKSRWRKRSSRACKTCNMRKVRCNVMAHGVPCSNCSHDEIECIVSFTNKKSPRKIAKASTQTDSNPQPPTSSKSLSWIQPPLASTPKRISSSKLSHEGHSISEIFAPFPSYIDLADLAYLHSHDALTLPSECLQVDLLNAYIEFVHGNMPVLDLEEFFRILRHGNKETEEQREKRVDDNNPKRETVSLLLFQAVLFAGVEYVSIASLENEGYDSREMARRIFFNRVRLLYNLDTCIDHLTIVQSLLLMTLCPAGTLSAKDNKDAWHWLGQAISFSYRLGLNCNIGSAKSKPRRKRLKRRIWWTAFILDRTLSLKSRTALRRPVWIKNEDCSVDMLSLGDFELDDSERKYGELEKFKLKVNAVGLVEKAILCWCTNARQVSSLSRGCTHETPLCLVSSQDNSPPDHDLGQLSAPTPSTGTLNFCQTQTSTLLEYAKSNSSSSSCRRDNEDCLTPREETAHFVSADAERTVASRNADIDVAGEYEDYLEYMKGAIAAQECSPADISLVMGLEKDIAASTLCFGYERDDFMDI